MAHSRLEPSRASQDAADVGQALLSLPFDTLRLQYAGAVHGGWAPRSLLASGRFERGLGTLEKLMLGPLARRR